MKQLAKISAFRLKNQSLTPVSTTEKKAEDEKDKDNKPKKKVFATTLPPKTGAMYKEAYKEKLRREKEETTPTSKPEKPTIPARPGIQSSFTVT